MREAKASHIFSTKNIGKFWILTLTNNVVSFEQPGPDLFIHRSPGPGKIMCIVAGIFFFFFVALYIIWIFTCYIFFDTNIWN